MSTDATSPTPKAETIPPFQGFEVMLIKGM